MPVGPTPLGQTDPVQGDGPRALPTMVDAALPARRRGVDRALGVLLAATVAALLATTCGPRLPAGQRAEADGGLAGPASLTPAELAPDAHPAVLARAMAEVGLHGDGTVGPDELEAFFAALLRAEQERADADGPAVSVPAVVPAGVVLPRVETDDPMLFMVGDSVLLASYPTVQRMLPSWHVDADARVSRRPDEGAAVVERRAGDLGDVAVIVLGHNYDPGEGFARDFGGIMSVLWRMERVVWVTPVEWSAGPREVNAVLRDAPETWPNVVVADWAALAAANPGYLVADGVHLSPSGVVALADLIARAVGPGPIAGVPGMVAVQVPAGPGPDAADGPRPTSSTTWPGRPSGPTSTTGTVPPATPTTATVSTTSEPAPATTVATTTAPTTTVATSSTTTTSATTAPPDDDG
jgi:hypothetical protein